MNEFWNLDVIYQGFEDPAYKADFESLSQVVTQMGEFAQALPAMEPLAGLTKGIELEEKLEQLAMNLIEYAQLRQSVNTKDAEAGSQMGRLFGLLSDTAGPQAAFKAWASKLPNLMGFVQTVLPV